MRKCLARAQRGRCALREKMACWMRDKVVKRHGSTAKNRGEECQDILIELDKHKKIAALYELSFSGEFISKNIVSRRELLSLVQFDAC